MGGDPVILLTIRGMRSSVREVLPTQKHTRKGHSSGHMLQQIPPLGFCPMDLGQSCLSLLWPPPPSKPYLTASSKSSRVDQFEPRQSSRPEHPFVPEETLDRLQISQEF